MMMEKLSSFRNLSIFLGDWIRWAKYDCAYKRALYKRREQTKTFMFTTAHLLFRNYDCVGIGDYTPNGGGITTPMRRAMNNRSNGRFKIILSWVARKSGKAFLNSPYAAVLEDRSFCSSSYAI